MAYATIKRISDGVTTAYVVDFALGVINEEDVSCYVEGELDGTGEQAYRDTELLYNGLFAVSGPVPAAGAVIVFKREVSKTELVVDYNDGAPMTEESLDKSQKQSIMIAHEAIDIAEATALRQTVVDERFNSIDATVVQVTGAAAAAIVARAGAESARDVSLEASGTATEKADITVAATAVAVANAEVSTTKRNEAVAAAGTATGASSAAVAAANATEEDRQATNLSRNAAATSAGASELARSAAEALKDAALGFAATAGTEADRSTTQANRSKTEADRAQAAADSAGNGFDPLTDKFDQKLTTVRPFYEDLGARVHRVQDRMFIGAAVRNRGLIATAVGSDDYMEDDFPNTTSLSQTASLSTIGSIGLSGGSQSINNPNAGSMGCIGVMGRVLNNNPNQKQSAYGGYFDAVRANGAGNTHGLEVNIVNKAAQAPPAAYPHNLIGVAGQLSNALWVASGGEVATQDATSAIAIVNNGRAFSVGIIFQNNSLNGDKTAISMAADQHIRWFWANALQPRRQDEGNGTKISNLAGTEQAFFGSDPNVGGMLLRGPRLNIDGLTGIGGAPAAGIAARLPVYINGQLWHLPLYNP